MDKMRILFNLAGGPLKASSRVRGYWIAEALEKRGHKVTCMQVTGKTGYLSVAAKIARHDVVVFQKAYSRYDPFLVYWARMLGKRVLFDIDDAPSRISAPQVEHTARRMMRLSDGVFAGCTALVEMAKSVQPSTYLIPSGIRLDTYRPTARREDGGPVRLGWIGNGAHYAEDVVAVLAPVLRRIAADTPIRFRIVGACNDTRLYNAFGHVEGLETEFVDAIDWADPEAVNAEVSLFDIGLYPLNSGPFNDYKCGFKALEYMAMGLPVLASDAANHSEILIEGETGLLMRSEEDWCAALTRLISDPGLRARMGKAGLERVESQFSTDRIAEDIESYIINIGRGHHEVGH